MQLSDFKVGDRVQPSPATAYWMRGVRYGVVHKVRDGKLYVMLDRLHRIARLDPELIREIVVLPEAKICPHCSVCPNRRCRKHAGYTTGDLAASPRSA